MFLSYNEFVSVLSKVTRATSVTGQKYYDIHIIDNLICGKRGVGTSFQIMVRSTVLLLTFSIVRRVFLVSI